MFCVSGINTMPSYCGSLPLYKSLELRAYTHNKFNTNSHILHYGDVLWELGHLVSSASGLFVQKLIHANNNETSQICITDLFLWIFLYNTLTNNTSYSKGGNETIEGSLPRSANWYSIWGILMRQNGWVVITHNCTWSAVNHAWPWWRHQMETFSALLARCAGNLLVSGEFPSQRPVTRSFDVFFDLHPYKRLSKQ